MRYSREHKQETHARIVRKASVRLREKGAHGVGVADLMKEAGLTHGGFYAHFDSREALVIEAFAYAMDRSMEHWRKTAERIPLDKRLSTIVDTYLTPIHRDDPGHGCAARAFSTAARTSALEASATLAWTSPVIGSKTSAVRPEVPLTSLPPMKCPTERMASSIIDRMPVLAGILQCLWRLGRVSARSGFAKMPTSAGIAGPIRPMA